MVKCQLLWVTVSAAGWTKAVKSKHVRGPNVAETLVGINDS